MEKRAETGESPEAQLAGQLALHVPAPANNKESPLPNTAEGATHTQSRLTLCSSTVALTRMHTSFTHTRGR